MVIIFSLLYVMTKLKGSSNSDEVVHTNKKCKKPKGHAKLQKKMEETSVNILPP